MSLSAAAIRIMAEKGLSALDIAEIAESMDVPNQRTANAERQARYRARVKAEKDAADNDMSVTDNVTDNVTDVIEAPLSPPPNEKISNPPTHTPGYITRARKAPHILPADWTPILTDRAQKTVNGWPPGKFEREVAKFTDHAADKGRTSKDWQAAFRKWIENADEWKPANAKSASNDEPQNPYVRAVLERQAGRAGVGF